MKKMEYVKNIKKPRRFNIAANLGYWCFAFFVIAVFCAAAGIGGLPPSTAAALLSAWFVVSVLLIGIRKADEWQRAIVLRFGKFKAVHGPGLFFAIPFIDRVAQIVDMRIRVSDFSAQETLTLDSVAITVDALCFWLVWDPEKAVLEVETYEDAVILSSKTALRSAISSSDLTTFLRHGDVIEKQIQSDVDKKTNEWGVTVLYTEITDIQIPEALQDSLSRLAQAEREKKGRILLAEAEIEIAKKLEEAARIYQNCEPAIKLKAFSILNEGLKAGNSMMLIPNSIAEELKNTDIFGLQALGELRNKQKSE
ncbi:MAG: slipin family protein [Spirochaetaceae bacterium]|jgi:regulator of protease activity HflC (stomatin/prohibitin superfamily)|nr:slipin family protein [Spirochaetaceae bacterium]